MNGLKIADVFDPRGRANRKGLFKGALVLIALQAAVQTATTLTASSPSAAAETAMQLQLALFWPTIVVVSKRLHDLGYRLRHAAGGLATIAALASGTALAAVALMGEEALLPGELGYLLVAAAVFMPAIGAAIWLQAAQGIEGPNRYGEEPGESGFSSPVADGARKQALPAVN